MPMKTVKPHVLLIYRSLIPSVRLCGHCQMEYLDQQGKVEYRPRQEMRLKSADLNWADIVLLGRLDSWYERKLTEQLHKAGKYLIYILDDDLLNVPPEISSAAFYNQPETKRNIRSMIEMSDAIASPSPLLLEKYAVDGRRAIQVEEPAIDPVPYKPHDPSRPVKIGFAGSIDRTGDLERILKDALLQIKREFGDRVEFEFFGAIPSFARELDARCIPYCDSYDRYRRTLNALEWDIGLAPMPDTPFHNCKHYNKFIEYAAAGIVGVFSNVEPYTRLKGSNADVIICDNSTEEWTRAIGVLMSDSKLREDLRKKAVQSAAETLSLHQTAQEIWGNMEHMVPYVNTRTYRSFGLKRLKIVGFLLRVLEYMQRRLQWAPHLILICRGIESMFQCGIRATWQRVKAHRAAVRQLRRSQELSREARRQMRAWAETRAYGLLTPENFGCHLEELKAQGETVFSRDLKFSILVPLYNTPEKFLKEMIGSVLLQTYVNWELCLTDGSTEAHPEVGRICTELAKKDNRIKYRKLEKNLGISGNTNACMEMASGDYIGLLDHDDLLHPAALYKMMEAICAQNADFIYSDEAVFQNKPRESDSYHFKPDYAPDTLCSLNYICHFTVFRDTLLQQVGEFRSECNGSQDYDIILRLTEQAKNIVHIPQILYYWRAAPNSTASNVMAKPYVFNAAHQALADHLLRIGRKGDILDSSVPTVYRIRYAIPSKDLVSIIICTKDHVDDLRKCVDSILKLTTYPNYEIILVENNSTEPDTFQYYRELEQKDNIHILTEETPSNEFNFSYISNRGVAYAQGKYVLLLNNDTEVITPEWLEEMVMFAQREDVGAVGAKLYYPDDTIQHAGVCIGIGGLAGHYHKGSPRAYPGYLSRLVCVQNVSAVTAACILLRKEVWDEVGGLDETFKVAFNDVDFCMRIRQAGYLIVWTPFAELYHYESKTRGYEDTPEKKQRFEGEVHRFQSRWAEELAAGDPYYNPNLTLDREDLSPR